MPPEASEAASGAAGGAQTSARSASQLAPPSIPSAPSTPADSVQGLRVAAAMQATSTLQASVQAISPASLQKRSGRDAPCAQRTS